jgi:hypothetical protein
MMAASLLVTGVAGLPSADGALRSANILRKACLPEIAWGRQVLAALDDFFSRT